MICKCCAMQTVISVLAMKLTAFLCFSAFNLHWVAGTKESGLGLHVGNGNDKNENGNGKDQRRIHEFRHIKLRLNCGK